MVYDELEAMRSAATRYAQRTGTSEPGAFGDAHGVTHTFQTLIVDPGGGVAAESEAVALIRLWRQRLGTGVVTHEVAHAATAIYEQDCLPSKGSIHDNISNEETFCYLVGDLASRIVSRLYFYGMYQ
jgi:hypothetical protein